MSSVQGVVFAVAMAGAAVMFLALKLQKSITTPEPEFQTDSTHTHAPASPPRPCISSGEKRKEKKKKRVRFAKDVAEPSTKNDEFRKRFDGNKTTASTATTAAVKEVKGGMPANRVALYNGILRDRVVHRMGYSY